MCGRELTYVEASQPPPSLSLLPPRQVGEDWERGEKGLIASSPGPGLGMIGKAALEGSLDGGAERYLRGVGESFRADPSQGFGSWDPTPPTRGSGAVRAASMLDEPALPPCA